MESYTYDEYADMQPTNAECLRNVKDATREYCIRYPHRRNPPHHIIPVVEGRCRTKIDFLYNASLGERVRSLRSERHGDGTF